MIEPTAPVQPRRGIGIEELRPRILWVEDGVDLDRLQKTLDFPEPQWYVQSTPTTRTAGNQVILSRLDSLPQGMVRASESRRRGSRREKS